MESLRGELRTIIAADELGFAVAQNEPVEDLQHIAGGHPNADRHGQGLTRVLVEHRQHLVAAAIAQLVVNEVPLGRLLRNRLAGNGCSRRDWDVSAEAGVEVLSD